MKPAISYPPRDPRMEPEAGDVVEAPDGSLYLVLERLANGARQAVVFYAFGMDGSITMTLEEWRRESARDRVVRIDLAA